MRNIQFIGINFLIFYFLIGVFNGVEINGGLVGKLIVGLVFGIVLTFVPTILGFFKLPQNWGAMFLLSLVISFIFFFLLNTGLFGWARITASSIVWSNGIVSVLDSLTTIVLVSLTSALASVWLAGHALVKKK